MLDRFKSREGRELILASYDRLLALWGTPFTEEDVVTSYGTTHIVRAGSGTNPPLLLFHGVGDNSALMWLYNARDWVQHFSIIAVDTLGGPGRSEPGERYSREFDPVLWLDEVMDGLGLEQVRLAGVSHGAYLAGVYTAVRQERVLGMVGMAGTPRPSLLRMLRVFLPEALLPASENTARRLLRKLTAPGCEVFEREPELLLHWCALLRYFNNRSMMQHKYRSFTREDLEILRMKALYLIGEHDPLAHYPAAIRHMIQHGIPYRVVRGAGHALNHEQPAIVYLELTGFLRPPPVPQATRVPQAELLTAAGEMKEE